MIPKECWLVLLDIYIDARGFLRREIIGEYYLLGNATDYAQIPTDCAEACWRGSGSRCGGAGEKTAWPNMEGELKGRVEDEPSPEKRVVTLQLLPVRSESDKSCGDSTDQKVEENRNIDPYKVDDEVTYQQLDNGGGGGTAALGSVQSVIKTWIIVECVTEIFIESGVGLGFSDGEKINKLQADTCPGFVSDGTHNVVWVNEAYRKMVAEGEMVGNGIMVWVVVKENLPHYSPSFACRVRMIQQTKHGHVWNRVVPCDVWRMQFSGGLHGNWTSTHRARFG
ncbi:UNVERIFIED_CONTAM: hypothetical protein Scaly_2089800 [Sesamum calycinum]|uniref:DUF7950 domain-containing protein n=1 Tax=Sesamum calycinum TaxID=2727403 RepID=A0AAW2MMY6_9LAMI